MGILEKQRYDSILNNGSEVAIYAALNEDSYMDVMHVLEMLKVKYSGLRCEISTPSHRLPSAPSKNEAGVATQKNKVLSPPVVRSKGMPLSKRKVLIVKRIVKQAKKKQLSKNKVNIKL
jgi:hypothetical protein